MPQKGIQGGQIEEATLDLSGVDGAGLSNVDAASLQTFTVGTGANQIVQLDALSRLPAVDGSLLTGVGGDLVNDLTPQLGGNLDVQTFNIITIDNAADTNTNILRLQGGNNTSATGGYNAGWVDIYAGAATGTNNGGGVNIKGGYQEDGTFGGWIWNKCGNGNVRGGHFYAYGGNAYDANGIAGSINIYGGYAYGNNGQGGGAWVNGGFCDATTDARGGSAGLLGGNADYDTVNGRGGGIIITSGQGGYLSGQVDITSGDQVGAGVSANRRSGTINIRSGSSTRSGGPINILVGTGGVGVGGAVSVGAGASTDADGGNATFSSGTSTNADGGLLSINGGQGGINGGNVRLIGGLGGTGTGGYAAVWAGNSSNGDGGDVRIAAGTSSAVGDGGSISLTPGGGSFGGGGQAIEVHGLAGEANVEGGIKFFRDTNIAHTTGNFVLLKARNTLAADLTFTLPIADGTGGQVLQTDGSGNLSFTTPAAAANNWVHANNGSDFVTAPSAPQLNSIAIGNNASTGYKESIAIGSNVTSTNYGISVGWNSDVTTTDGIAVGRLAQCSGGSGIAMGYQANNAQSFGVVIGRNSSATGAVSNGIAIGNNSDVTLQDQIAVGAGLQAASVTSNVAYSVKIGNGVTGANKNMMHLFDAGKFELYGAKAQFLIPTYATASEPANPVEGSLIYDSTLDALKTYDGAAWNTVGGGAVNNWITANNGVDFAVAPSAPAAGEYDIAIGDSAVANGSTLGGAVAIGSRATGFLGGANASAGFSTAVGAGTDATGQSSSAFGSNAQAIANGAVALGAGSEANSTYAIAVGRAAIARSADDIVMGQYANSGTGGQRSIIIGRSSATSTGVDRAVVIGETNTAALDSQIVIGNNLAAGDVTSDVSHSVKIGTGTADANKNIVHLYGKGKLELYGDEAQFVLPGYATASIPATTVVGGMIYDTDTDEIKVNDGVSWNAVSGGGGGGKPNTEQIVISGTPTVVNTTVGTVATAAGVCSLQVFRNGILQQEDLDGSAPIAGHYIVTGANQITFNTGILQNGDLITLYEYT